MKNDDEKRLIGLLQRKDSLAFDLDKFYHLTFDVILEMRNSDCEWSKIQYAGVVYNAMFRDIFQNRNYIYQDDFRSQ